MRQKTTKYMDYALGKQIYRSNCQILRLYFTLINYLALKNNQTYDKSREYAFKKLITIPPCEMDFESKIQHQTSLDSAKMTNTIILY